MSRYSIWGRGVAESSPVYRIRVHRLDWCLYDATVRVGRTAIAVHEATSSAAAVRMCVETVRRRRKSGALADLRNPQS